MDELVLLVDEEDVVVVVERDVVLVDDIEVDMVVKVVELGREVEEDGVHQTVDVGAAVGVGTPV